MSPTTDDYDRELAKQARKETYTIAIFKVLVPIVITIVIIIVVAVLVYFMQVYPNIEVPVPTDATTF